MKTSSQLIAAATATLWMAPTFAQEQGDPANAWIEIPESVTEFEQDPASVVEWDGLQAPNVLFDEPASELGSRAAAGSELAIINDLNSVYIKFIRDNLKAPDGKKSQRETAFELVNLVLVSGVVMPPTMTAARPR